MKLDLTSLISAIAVFQTALDSHQRLSRNSLLTDGDIETIKSGVIQNFEVAYEQSWKMMKRWIDINVDPQIADGVTRRELFRLAAENRLISDVDQWMRFHYARNLTSHTYDHKSAEKAFAVATLFLPIVKQLLKQLEKNNV